MNVLFSLLPSLPVGSPCVQAGKVSHALSAGSIVSAGELLAKLELKDPSKVRQVLQDCAGMVCSLGVYLL